MITPPFAPNRSLTTILSANATGRKARKYWLRCLASLFLIATLLSQVLLVGPIRKASAGRERSYARAALPVGHARSGAFGPGVLA